jgi:hypothetical protein
MTSSSPSSTNPLQDVLSIRVDGVAAAAKDAESAISLAMKQPSHSNDIEEINRRVLSESGIPHAKIRKAQKVRPVGKHIEFEPARKPITQQTPSLARSGIKNVPEPNGEELTPVDVEIESEGADEEDGHANEAFEAMEAMDFHAIAEFDYDSENHGTNDLAMDIGVD